MPNDLRISFIYVMEKGAKNNLKEKEMYESAAPEFVVENAAYQKDVSLFDLGPDDSGSSEDQHEDFDKPVRSPLNLENNEGTIMCFSPQVSKNDCTPAKTVGLEKKKRIYISPKIKSPSSDPVSSLKRWKIFDIENGEEVLEHDESDKALEAEDKLDKVEEESDDDKELLIAEEDYEEPLEQNNNYDLEVNNNNEGLEENSNYEGLVDNNYYEGVQVENNQDEAPQAESINDEALEGADNQEQLQEEALDSPQEAALTPEIEIRKGIVKDAVERSECEEDLIGDFSKSYVLPRVAGSHPDLKCISVETLRDVLKGKYADVVNSYKVVDSRYPYEFKGGHIRGAVNLCRKEDYLKMLDKPVTPTSERHILIIHCEFSKERGPSMVRYLRSEDRTRNVMLYPILNFPEVYILEGGYKKFFQSFPDHCDPVKYTEMIHPDYADEMRFFRKMCKSSDVSKTCRKPSKSRMVRKFRSNDLF